MLGRKEHEGDDADDWIRYCLLCLLIIGVSVSVENILCCKCQVVHCRIQ